ncbi:tRNA (adenosine(37)-N6)-dimethylallyltransferase MiaA [Nocardioides sp. Kera G14]|uniref:tRNA (adenosine(37)-N6)-dimethylallyltransferase MiaA n=1 Tax=Nocardioides sp. Kera G14 TaxID=2884264 RepID=UPI001D122102|nr:tRNA (adenosine(37)-N6)-dimethylallyltransferase MiaA [Nocardioides sp. Kera G14]UDY24138.1 tRNA (adenosine(37)-N6)-dimethylallyltransferase MiaA [Nocardioides sp. Kera G14]
MTGTRAGHDAERPIPIVAVVGATAAGKTGLSLDLAEALDGEILNTDAMQVYRGMDIGTAKLPVSERRGIPHHLLDLLDLDRKASVADFQALARGLIVDLRARGKAPVLVGGSALYTRAILDRFDFPGTDPAVRERLEAELETGGYQPLLARLQALDPVGAERIESMTPGNGRRIVRALEVIELTGQPFSARLPINEYVDLHSIQIGVDIDRDTLETRITQRVREMFESGFVEEVEALMARGLLASRTASTAIGYREVAQLLGGVLTREEAIERTIIKTRQFARRQDQWFRKDHRVVWVRFDDPTRVEKALAAIATLDR